MNLKQENILDSPPQRIDPFILLFSITLFLSAGLTFTIQPMVGKMLLPIVGGAPSGWLVTMVYFQLALLAGYSLAHVLSYTSVTKHIAAIIIFLLAGITAFPLHLQSSTIDSSGLPEAFGVLLTLFLSLTVPCVSLFTLSPSLQRLFEKGSSGTRRDPYFLFAASNVGSLGGLLAYPIVIEHISGLSIQTRFWQSAYIILIVLCAFCLLFSWKQARTAPAKILPLTTEELSWKKRGRWFLLAFIPSSLMVGVTAHVTSDLGGVPFFWVLPLALYLLTFILAFADRQSLSLTRIDFLQTASVGLLMAFFAKTPSIVSNPEEMIFPIIAFFLTALFCHLTLAAERPATQKLTEFYLWIALGGALGGSFNIFVAPFILPLPIEFMLVIILSCLIHPQRPVLKNPKLRRFILIASVLTTALAIICVFGTFDPLPSHIPSVAATALLAIMFVIVSISPRLLVLLSFSIGIFAVIVHSKHMLDVQRNFFGVTRVFETQNTKAGISIRMLYHGSTIHGQEQMKPTIDTTPNSYYDVDGPLGDLMSMFKPSDVGIVGMGVGTSLCYQNPGRHFTIYEIDPAIPGIAEKWFDYIRVCGRPEIRIGDGRRMLAAATDERYDLLTLDAFTSDAIPLHLLTKEAFEIYLIHLNPHGILAVHISNRFYDLRQPISNVIADLGLSAVYKTYIPPSSKLLAVPTRWVAVARNADELAALRQHDWVDLPSPTDQIWTDDFSDPLSTLIISQPKLEATHAQAN